eukprot:4658934-Amphidinium_carterae.1
MRTCSDVFLPAYDPPYEGALLLEHEAECPFTAETEQFDLPTCPEAAIQTHRACREVATETAEPVQTRSTALEACVQSGPGLAASLQIFIGAHYVARDFHPTSV